MQILLKQLLLPSLLITAAILSPTNSRGQTAISACSFQTVNRVDFGGYDVFNHTATDTIGNIAYRCNDSNGHNDLTIILSRGNARNFNRFMQKQNQRLYYNLYLDPARQMVWGDGVSGTARYSSASIRAGVTYRVPIYGRIPPQQSVPAGQYRDSLIITLNF